MAGRAAVLAAVTADPDRTPEEIYAAGLAAAARLVGDAGTLELETPEGDFVYTALDGDTLDLIAFRRYGTVAAVRHVQAANPELTTIGPRLPAGTRVRLPDIEVAPVDEARIVQLWE